MILKLAATFSKMCRPPLLTRNLAKKVIDWYENQDERSLEFPILLTRNADRMCWATCCVLCIIGLFLISVTLLVLTTDGYSRFHCTTRFGLRGRELNQHVLCVFFSRTWIRTQVHRLNPGTHTLDHRSVYLLNVCYFASRIRYHYIL